MKNHRFRFKGDTPNAGTLADIAFLLLIFFLVATTINQESGIQVDLPEWKEEETPPDQYGKTIHIKINAQNEILLDEKQINSTDLSKNIVNNFNSYLQESDHLTLFISLQHDRATLYQNYLVIYDQIKKAQRIIWQQFTEEETQEIPPEVQQNYRLKVSEIDPTSYGIEAIKQ